MQRSVVQRSLIGALIHVWVIDSGSTSDIWLIGEESFSEADEIDWYLGHWFWVDLFDAWVTDWFWDFWVIALVLDWCIGHWLILGFLSDAWVLDWCMGHWLMLGFLSNCMGPWLMHSSLVDAWISEWCVGPWLMQGCDTGPAGGDADCHALWGGCGPVCSGGQHRVPGGCGYFSLSPTTCR